MPALPFGAPAARKGDHSSAACDTHGCPACPHTVLGPATGGSPDVFINDRPALRDKDPGVHAGCCGANTWVAIGGSKSVFINGRPAHRKGDPDQHCGGRGRTLEGSRDVFFA